MKNNLLNQYTIAPYTTADREYVFNNSKLVNGFPLYYPIKNKLGKRVIISFVDAYICDLKKQRIDDEIANFDLLEQDVFDPNDPIASTKVKFIKALFSEKYLVQGGVYFKGKYYTSKMTVPKAKFLLKSFINGYFYIEDSDMLKEKFFEDGDKIPFWPTKSHNDSKILMFSAVNATIINKNDPSNVVGPYNFDIYAGETLDFNDANDMNRIEVIRSLVDKDRIVKGFYYKGVLLEDSLSDAFKEYLIKNFIKKNFVVEQKNHLLTYVPKDVSGYPMFWPCFDQARRPICVSVINASASFIKSEKYTNFNVYDDEVFDLMNPEYQMKLRIIRSLFYRQGIISGALYFDGLLVNYNAFDRANIEHRKNKVEKALKIYITNSEDFLNINSRFTTADRERLIRLSAHYDDYFPNNITEVPTYLYGYDPKGDVILNIVNANYINSKGDYAIKENVNFELKKGEQIIDKDVVNLLYAIYDQTTKVRGGIYFKGKNIAKNNNALAGQFLKIMPTIISNYSTDFLSHKMDRNDVLTLDKYSNLPLYWPTSDAEGRRVLLSVVDADIHFKVGHGMVVKAVNNATFDIYEGETFGLVGESGSGKTTISRAILGINKLTKGAIYYGGKLISSKMSKVETLKTKKNIQMIFQDPAASLNERANIDYIISEGPINFKMFKTSEERLAKVTSLLNSVGLLPEHLSRYPHEFSGGQRQRIGIARALAIEPSLVLADEPISALDVSIRAQVLNLLKKLQKEKGLTYLFIAHDLSIIRYISDRIAVMHNGFIVELGVAEEIYTHPLHPYTRSLLTAIPQPDPRTKDKRKKVPYNQGDIVYEKCVWKEMKPGHFVLVNDKLEEEIKERIKKMK